MSFSILHNSLVRFIVFNLLFWKLNFIAGSRIFVFLPFPNILLLCDRLTTLSSIWIRVTVSISYNKIHYTTYDYVRMCIYIYIYIYIYVCVCVSLHLLIHINMSIYIYTHTHTCTCMSVYVYLYVCLYIHVCMYLCINLYLSISLNIYMPLCVCVYIYIYIYIIWNVPSLSLLPWPHCHRVVVPDRVPSTGQKELLDYLTGFK